MTRIETPRRTRLGVFCRGRRGGVRPTAARYDSASRRCSIRTPLDSLAWLVVLALAAPVALARTDAPLDDAATPPEEEVADWPRVIEDDATSVVMYQPQIDRWDDFKRISARVAVAVKLDDEVEPQFGTLRMTATTVIDFPSRSVLLGRRKIAGAMFPDTDASTYKRMIAAIEKALPNEKPLTMALDEIVAYLEPEMFPAPEVEVNFEPPPILWSDAPAILVLFIGEPKFEDVPGSDELLFAINTNWDLFLHVPSAQYYLLDGESWLAATDLSAGPWSPAAVSTLR